MLVNQYPRSSAEAWLTLQDEVVNVAKQRLIAWRHRNVVTEAQSEAVGVLLKVPRRDRNHHSCACVFGSDGEQIVSDLCIVLDKDPDRKRRGFRQWVNAWLKFEFPFSN